MAKSVNNDVSMCFHVVKEFNHPLCTNWFHHPKSEVNNALITSLYNPTGM